MEGSDWSACGPRLDFVENDIVDSGTELLFYKKKVILQIEVVRRGTLRYTACSHQELTTLFFDKKKNYHEYKNLAKNKQ